MNSIATNASSHPPTQERGGDSCPAPCYASDRVTLYLGDCLTILQSLTPGLVYMCDQPYGTGWVRGGGNDPNGGPHPFKARGETAEWDVWNLEWLEVLNAPKRIAAFCPVGKCEELCNALPMPAVMHYKKTNVRPGGKDREPIVVSPPPPMAKKYKGDFYNDEMPLHPCQKPLDLMVWLVESVTDESDTVVDNFMGSGTTAIACLRTGRKFIGIEKDPTHFATALERIKREESQGTLALAHNKKCRR